MFRRHRPPPEVWDATTPDEDLVGLAQGGDREAFAVLYDRYLPRVHGYCYRLLGTREAAEDANTEVFMRALAALPAYRAGSFRAWLFAIAHNVVTDEFRRRRPVSPLEDVTHLTDRGPAVADVAASAADWSSVLALLPQLSTDQQQVIAMRLSGLTAIEIGQALGKPRNAVDGIHHRALLRLRSLVATGEPAANATTKGGR